MSADVLFTKPTNNKLLRTWKQPQRWDAVTLYLLHETIFSQQPLTNSVSWEYYRIHHTVIAIKVPYLVLVDEEKHDGQNLQEEDEQEQNEELWRHKGKRKGQLSDWIQFIWEEMKTTGG